MYLPGNLPLISQNNYQLFLHISQHHRVYAVDSSKSEEVHLSYDLTFQLIEDSISSDNEVKLILQIPLYKE